jgi:hypothetical protein
MEEAGEYSGLSSQGAEVQTSSNGFATGDNNQSRNKTAVHQKQDSAMKIICLLTVCTSLLLSCGQTDNNTYTSVLDSTQIYALKAQGFSSDVIEKLQEWREDSLGCLGYRHRLMNDNYFFESLQLESSSKQEVLDALGDPNEWWEPADSINIEVNEIRFGYQTKSECITEAGIVRPVSIQNHLHVIFDYQTQKVTKVLGSVH